MPENCEICGAKLGKFNTSNKCLQCLKQESLSKREAGRRKRASAPLAAEQASRKSEQKQASKPEPAKKQEQTEPLADDPYFTNHCESCGAKLGRLDSSSEKNKPRKKCYDCVKGREKSALLTYHGGFAGLTRENVQVRMQFKPSCVSVESSPIFGKGDVLWTMPYNKIKKIQVDTVKNLTATRLLLTGVLAFGLKKKHHYLAVSFEDEVGLEQTPVFDGTFMNSAQKAIYDRIVLEKHKAQQSE